MKEHHEGRESYGGDEDSDGEPNETSPFEDATDALDLANSVLQLLRRGKDSATHLSATTPRTTQVPKACHAPSFLRHLRASYNVVYVIEFSDGVKWVARITGKGTEFEELDIKKMDTDYQTMRFIKACTSISLPTVFTWETSEGVAGAPIALMSFVESSQLSDRWVDKSWITEEKRRKILSGIATLVLELAKFPFDALGALEFDRDRLASGLGGYI